MGKNHPINNAVKKRASEIDQYREKIADPVKAGFEMLRDALNGDLELEINEDKSNVNSVRNTLFAWKAIETLLPFCAHKKAAIQPDGSGQQRVTAVQINVMGSSIDKTDAYKQMMAILPQEVDESGDDE